MPAKNSLPSPRFIAVILPIHAIAAGETIALYQHLADHRPMPPR